MPKQVPFLLSCFSWWPNEFSYTFLQKHGWWIIWRNMEMTYPFMGEKGSSSLSLVNDFPSPRSHRHLTRFPHKVWSPSYRMSLKSSHKVIGFNIEPYHYYTNQWTYLAWMVMHVIHRAHNWLLMTPTNRSLHTSSLPIFHITWLHLFHWDTNSKSTSDDCPRSISIPL